MIGLAHLTTVAVPRDLFEQGHSLLRKIGLDDVEGLILWAGSIEGDTARIEAVLYPAQRAVHTERGLLVLVDGPELHRIGVWLYERRLQLVAQIHTHPTDAYHSPTDDAIPIVTTEGGLSLVVPDFARGDAQIETYAAYRLNGAGEYQELSSRDLRGLIAIGAPSCD